MNKKYRYYMVFFFSLILALFIVRKFVFNPGYVYLYESFEFFSAEGFLRVVYPIWNDRLQYFDLAAQPKLYVYYLFYLLVSALGESYKSLQALLLISPVIIGFTSMFILAKHVIKSRLDDAKLNTVALYCAGLSAYIYIINPWFATNARNIFWRIEFAIFPFIIYIFIKMIKSENIYDKMRFGIIFAILLAVFGGYRYITILTIVIAIIFITNLIAYPELKKQLRSFIVVVFSYILSFFLSLPKFLPAVLYSKYSGVQAVQEFSLSEISRDILIHIFTTKVYGNPVVFREFDMTYDDNLHYLFLIVTIFSLSYLLFWTKKDEVDVKFISLFPITIFVLFILLTAKHLNVDTIILNCPLSNFLGRLLRHARWNIMPIILSISVMFGLSSIIYLSKFRKVGHISLIVIILFASISSWPLFTGDMNGFWNPSPVPEHIKIANKKISQSQGLHHTLWSPVYVGSPSWSNQTGVTNHPISAGITPVRASSTPSYLSWKFYFFNYYNPLNRGVSMSVLPNFRGNLAKIYSDLNIKYIVLHYSETPTNYLKARGFTKEYFDSRVADLDKEKWADKLYSSENISVYSLRNDAKEFKIKYFSISFGGLKDHASIQSLPNGKKIGIVYANYGIKTHKAPILINPDQNSFIINKLLNESKVIAPSSIIKITPQLTDGGWDSAAMDQSQYKKAKFENLLLRNSINWNWDLDYGQGLVFTFSPNAKITLPFKVDEQNNYKLFIRYFENQKGGTIKVYVDGKPIKIETKDQLNKFVWKDLGTFNLTEGEHELVLENVEGFNAVNIFSLIPEDDYLSQKKTISGRLAG